MDEIAIGKIKKGEILDAWQKWIQEVRPWRHFVTLTYREFRYPDFAMKDWRYLVRILNEELFGLNYHNRIHHSYFSYVLGVEKQSREVIHFHALIDRPINFQKIHSWWNNFCGFAWISEIKSQEDCIRYVCKYVMKDGDISPFLAREDLQPKTLPLWWF